METKIFARLTAWQNWIFTRPERGRARTARCARYGTGQRAVFDRKASLTHVHARLHRADPQQRQPGRGPAAAARRWSPGSPHFLHWWETRWGPALPTQDVYLRTAVAVGREGWANFAHVKHAGVPVGHLPGRARSRTGAIALRRAQGRAVPGSRCPASTGPSLQRLIVVQGDTEPASVEQQRQLGADRAQPVRPAQPVPGQRRGRPAPVGDGLPAARATSAATGREEAEALLQRNSGSADSPRILGAFNEETPDWLSFFMFTYFTDRDGKYQLGTLQESAFDPLSRTCEFMLKEEAHHMFVGHHRRGPGGGAHRRADA